MSNSDPFDTRTLETTLSAIVKNMERRWGLTLVSFLPPEARERLLQLQGRISRPWDGKAEDRLSQGRFYLELYQPRQLHCTHLTLTRSDPGGPVKAETFVKEGRHLFQLFETIHELTSQSRPFQVRLDCLRIAPGGLGIVLLGECIDDESPGYRQFLLSELNRTLPGRFNVSMRDWDTDPSEFHRLHCTLGYIKRPLPQGYGPFAERIEGIELSPLSFTLKDVTLIHHKQRTLAFPQEGSVDFPLGKRVDLSEDEFIRQLNLTTAA